MAVAFGLASNAYSTIDAADAAGARPTTTTAPKNIPASTRLKFPMVPPRFRSLHANAETTPRDYAVERNPASVRAHPGHPDHRHPGLVRRGQVDLGADAPVVVAR